MASIKIEATARTSVGTSATKALRRTGQIPAVVYGRGEPTVSLAINCAEMTKALNEHAQTFELSLEGKAATVLLCDAQFDLSGEFPTHVDFKRVAADETVEVDVEVKLKGTAIGEKSGGKLDHSRHVIKVRCFPSAIPEMLIGHVDDLELGDVLRAADLELPEGVELANDPQQAVASVHRAGGDTEGEATTEAGTEGDSSEPEVIGKKADDAGEESGE